jgi:hypothetical protein
MATKNNIRSFRYSDEVGGILEKFKGNTLNEKFENLVLYCFWNMEKIDRQIAQKQKEYDTLCKKVEDKRKELYDLGSLIRQQESIAAAMARIEIDVINYRERLKKTMQEENVTQNDAAAS